MSNSAIHPEKTAACRWITHGRSAPPLLTAKYGQNPAMTVAIITVVRKTNVTRLARRVTGRGRGSSIAGL